MNNIILFYFPNEISKIIYHCADKINQIKLNMLSWCVNELFIKQKYTLVELIRSCNDVRDIEWLVIHLNIIKDMRFYQFISSKSINEDVIMHYYDTAQQQTRDYMFEFVCSNKLEFVKKIIKNHSLTIRCISWAAFSGKLDIVKYLHEQGCPWNGCVLNDSCFNGHLEVTKYLYKNGCPVRRKALTYTITRGYLSTLKYLYESLIEYHWDDSYLSEAALCGNVEIIKYLHNNNFPWNNDIMINAVMSGKLDAIKYLHENDFPWNEDVLSIAINRGNLDIIKYVYENIY